MSAPTCPGCGASNVDKTGHPDKLGLDVYRCPNCGCRFTVETKERQRAPASVTTSGSGA